MQPSKREGILLDIFKEVSKLEGLSPLQRVQEHERRAIALGIDPNGPSEDEDQFSHSGDSDCESDSSLPRKSFVKDEFSSDDESEHDGYAIIWTRFPSPPKESLEKRIYSPETLMSLIPEKPEFDGLREKLKIQKTVFRFDPKKSNRQYSSEYYAVHGHGVPKDHPRVAVQVRGDELNSFFGKKRPFVKKGIPFGGKDQLLMNRVVGGRVVKTRKVGTIPKCSIIGFKDRKGKNVSSSHNSKTVYREFLLGFARNHPRNLDPHPGHKKYWYFKRTRGVWHPSEHHAYGDEMGIYPNVT